MWIIYSQISAISEALASVIAKRSMSNYDSVIVTWSWVTSSTILLFLILLLTGIPEIKSIFWIVFIARIALDTVALLLYTKAMQLEDLTLILPLYNFSAIFTLTFSFIFNGELPSALGIVGIFIVVLGAYLLNYDSKNKDLIHPIKSIFKNKGSLFMFVSAMIYGAIFSISKIGIESSSLIFYTFVSALGLSISIFPIAFLRRRNELKLVLKPRNFIKLFPLGAIDTVKILGLMAAINTSFVSFADVANNTSTIYNLGLSRLFLKEKIQGRVIPTLIMFIGLIIIILS